MASAPLSIWLRRNAGLFPLKSHLPPEPGEYTVYISVMREHVAWFYDRGWPFLLIDVAVDDDGERNWSRLARGR